MSFIDPVDPTIQSILQRLSALEANQQAPPGEQLTPSYLQVNPSGGVGLDSRYLATANDLSDVPDPQIALENLGVGPIASWFLANTQTYSDAAWAPMLTDTIDSDPFGLLTYDGQSYFFTAPAEGLYLCIAAMNYSVAIRSGTTGTQTFEIGVGFGQYLGVGSGNLLAQGEMMASVLGVSGGSNTGPIGPQALTFARLMGLAANEPVVPMIYADSPRAGSVGPGSQLLGSSPVWSTYAQVFRVS